MNDRKNMAGRKEQSVTWGSTNVKTNWKNCKVKTYFMYMWLVKINKFKQTVWKHQLELSDTEKNRLKQKERKERGMEIEINKLSAERTK